MKQGYCDYNKLLEVIEKLIGALRSLPEPLFGVVLLNYSAFFFKDGQLIFKLSKQKQASGKANRKLREKA